MNIKEAKQEICNTLRAYHRKDEAGNYLYPLVRQRPILLMGPPGIGKTAIMEQAARESQVGLVSYTITHHTRQSAIGLPHIEKRTYQGTEHVVTEYTLSEIIASVYEYMEQTGKKEGILFIDEINCVSETLAPTMLQFLQNKTFGSHKVPDGWMIVAAGNPPEYNKSVREFDIVTLDRVRKIDIEVDVDVWMEYAWAHGVHGAILSYLSIKKDRFYLVENTVDGKFFVTARGWEDLSELIKSYEALDIPVMKALVQQFLQKEEVADDFAAYYQLYCKYGEDYAIPQIIEGTIENSDYEKRTAMAAQASFEERFTVVGLVLACLAQHMKVYEQMDAHLHQLHLALKYVKDFMEKQGGAQGMSAYISFREDGLRVKIENELAGKKEIEEEQWILARLKEYELILKKEHLSDSIQCFDRIRQLFAEAVEERKNRLMSLREELERAFSFVADCFGDDQEMVLFVSGLSKNESAMKFIGEHGCDSYFRYSEALLYRKQEEQLKKAIKEEMKND
ncbi:MAG: MoxR family ATPase [Dorea formicigenerans]|nr:MoxR family ATPase [Dorea formicigenerans]